MYPAHVRTVDGWVSRFIGVIQVDDRLDDGHHPLPPLTAGAVAPGHEISDPQQLLVAAAAVLVDEVRGQGDAAEGRADRQEVMQVSLGTRIKDEPMSAGLQQILDEPPDARLARLLVTLVTAALVQPHGDLRVHHSGRDRFATAGSLLLAMQLPLSWHQQTAQGLAELVELAGRHQGHRQQVRVVSSRLVDEGVQTHGTSIGRT
ncbi:hypothetical protein ACIRG5_13825 [Lentzea sp. NPDC102401]|uniref:hypothetical protein n=1 Tax=Lentzea sp. NPDC102401 TaxID=3364128 RepID=UPI003805002B